MAKGSFLDSWDDFEDHQAGGKDPGLRARSIVPFEGAKKVKKSKSYSSHGKDDGHRCYHKHPPLKLPGTELVIYGGSCSTPAVPDADVYIGFDWGMKFTARHWPWRKGAEVLFEINDMSVPKSPKDFKALVAWTKTQLEEGKKVHCGCVGGHGRTGTFLAALCSEFGEKDAIAYVRKNYCASAVESSTQTAFLSEHFGVAPAKGAKSGFTPGSSKTSAQGGQGSYRCVESPACIWG